MAEPNLDYTTKNKFPSALQAIRADLTPGGPVLVATKVAPKPAVKKPVAKVPAAPTKRVAPRKALPLLRPTKMQLRVGVPKVFLRGKKVSSNLRKMSARVSGPQAGRTVSKTPAGRTVIRTAGKTKIIGQGGNRVVVATKQGNVIRNKRAGTVIRTKYATPTSNKKVVKKWGVGTATKADNARAVKVSGPNRAVLRYKGPKGGTVRVARRANQPTKVRVRITRPSGKTTKKVIGIHKTRITGPGGRTRVVKTRYISQKRRQNVTPKVGERGWGRGNTKPVKKGVAKKVGAKKAGAGLQGIRVRGNWKNIAKFRRIRRRRGARYNQSLTRGQLKGVASRSLS